MSNIIRWTEMKRVSFNNSLHPRMLLEEGYETGSSISLKDEPQGAVNKFRRFHFDRSYVIAYIITKIIKPMYFTSYENLESVIHEAWNEYHKKEL
jgi:hypothetical protein